MRTLVWWTVWGMVVGIGLFGLRESARDSLHLVMAMPLLSGAAAAAVLRLRHEYHEALQHAKWLFISSIFLLLGTGYVYIKAEAYGPFATGTAHKAFLGTTFEMSEPEVERALSRRLPAPSVNHPTPDGLRDWIMEMVPNPEQPADIRTLPNVIIYGVPSQAAFEFVHGRLGKVQVSFEKTAQKSTPALLARIADDLSKSYQPAASDGKTPVVAAYRKDDVMATLSRVPVDSAYDQVQVLLDYLPLADKNSDPLTVNAQAF